jgi:hypothetical protein
MKTALRVLLVVVGFISFYYFTYWVPLSLIPGVHKTGILATTLSLVVAGAVAVFLWKKTDSLSNGLASSILLGGIIIGGISFVAGFFGPVIFSWGGNQGPLLGILYTGPIGFVVGLVAGALYWLIRRKKVLPIDAPSTGNQ